MQNGYKTIQKAPSDARTSSTQPSGSSTVEAAKAQSPFDELYHLLEKSVVLYGTLVETLKAEYLHMGALDIASLAEAAHTKEVLLSELVMLENLRIQAARRLGASLRLSQADPALTDLAAAMPAPQAAALRAGRETLNLLVAQARELNAKNAVFAESSLARIDQMKRNVLGQSNNGGKENYSNAGVRENVNEQGGRLLETEA